MKTGNDTSEIITIEIRRRDEARAAEKASSVEPAEGRETEKEAKYLQEGPGRLQRDSS